MVGNEAIDGWSIELARIEIVIFWKTRPQQICEVLLKLPCVEVECRFLFHVGCTVNS